MDTITPLLIYGCYGYTGRLITEEAVNNGLHPVVAGRNAEKVKSVAEEFQLPYRVFDLDQPQEINQHLQDIKVVLHCAGPFSATSKPMADACIATGTDYLDITGEYQVFEALAARNNEAEAKDVMLLPGVGFDVVPSDCLAVYLHTKMPDATHLKLAFASGGRPSRGTMKTAIESLGSGCVIRKDGQLKKVPAGYKHQTIPFADKPRVATTIPWGDIASAYRSTGIPNIEVYMYMPEKQRKMAGWQNILGPVLSWKPVQNFLKKQIDKQQPGPTEQQRQKSQVQLWGEVIDEEGNKHQATLVVPDGYALTARASVFIAKNILQQEKRKAGYETPASLYGYELILQLEGTKLNDA